MEEIEFVDGLIAKEPHAEAPDFVKANLSIKRADLGNWLRGKQDEWINVDIKVSKAGKWYASVNNWKPEPKQEVAEQPAQPEFDDDVPF